MGFKLHVTWRDLRLFVLLPLVLLNNLLPWVLGLLFYSYVGQENYPVLAPFIEVALYLAIFSAEVLIARSEIRKNLSVGVVRTIDLQDEFRKLATILRINVTRYLILLTLISLVLIHLAAAFVAFDSGTEYIPMWSHWNIVVTVLVIGIVAPIAEEYYYRVAFFSKYRRQSAGTFFFCVLAFVLPHMRSLEVLALVSLASVTLLAILIVATYMVTRSFLVALFTHCFFNLFSIALTYTNMGKLNLVAEHANLILAVLVVCLAAIYALTLALLWKIHRLRFDGIGSALTESQQAQ